MNHDMLRKRALNCMNLSLQPRYEGGIPSCQLFGNSRREGHTETNGRKNVSISDTLTRNQPLPRSSGQNLRARSVDCHERPVRQPGHRRSSSAPRPRSQS